MKRKTCYQSKKDNPNWCDKIDNELSERNTTTNIYVVGSNGVGVPSFKPLRFMDSIITNNNKMLSYSCEVIN